MTYRRAVVRLTGGGLVAMAVVGGAATAAALEAPDPSSWSAAGLVRARDERDGGALLGFARRGGADGGARPFAAQSQLDFVNPAAIHEVEVEAEVLDVLVEGSGFPVPPAFRIDGFFSWDGTGSGGPADQTGHVQGNIRIFFSETARRLVAAYFVQKCLDAPCGTTQVIANQAFPQPIAPLERHVLRIAFDRPTGRFAFQFDGGPPASVVLADPVRLAPAAGFMRLSSRAILPASPTAFARFLARLDNVKVNGALYDDFDRRRTPRVAVVPGDGVFRSDLRVPVTILVETGGEPVTALSLFLDGEDVSSLVPAAARQPIPGGEAFSFPSVSMGSLVAPGQTRLAGAVATTASGRRATGFALWHRLP